MPKWYYGKQELRKTPSIVDGLNPDTEARYRRDGARFIHEIGNKLGLQSETKATGIIYFHRFYMFHSFRDFPRYVTACCCLFLAGKVEETPKKCKDIIKNARTELTDQQFAQFGDDPREEVMTLERILLQTVHFDLQVDNPYRYIVKYAKSLKGNKEKLQTIVQSAWTFVNDSLCTTLCLQWEPEIIAIALMYLASKLSKFEVQDWVGKTPKQQKWWDMFVEGLSTELLEDICHQVLDLYSSPASTGNASPPTGRQATRSSSLHENTPPSTQKVPKVESPHNGRTPPMTTTSSNPVEVVKVPNAPTQPVSITPTQAAPPPPIISVVQPQQIQPVPVLQHAIPQQTPPVINPPANVIVANTTKVPPPTPPNIPPPSAVPPFRYQYPPVTASHPPIITMSVPSYGSSTTSYQQSNFPTDVPPPSVNNPPSQPKLYPPPLPPPPAAGHTLPGPNFHSYIPPPPVTNASFQQNFQQFPPGRAAVPPNQFRQQFTTPPPTYNIPPPVPPPNMRPPPSNY